MQQSSQQQQQQSQLKWSNGIKYEKSPRRSKTTNNNTEEYDDSCGPEYTNPVARALNDQETWTIDEQGTYFPTIPYTIGSTDQMFNSSNSSNSSNISNKREETYNKMGEREMVAQIGRNRFMDSSTSYANDISSSFLIPENTSRDKLQNS